MNFFKSRLAKGELVRIMRAPADEGRRESSKGNGSNSPDEQFFKNEIK